MIEKTANLQGHTVVGRLTNSRLKTVSIVLAAITIIGSAFHFWPFEDSKIWQLFNLSNISVMVWILLMVVIFFLNRHRNRVIFLLPHLSVFAYLCINILSAAFTSNLERTVNYNAKLSLILVGGYTLFKSVISNERSLKAVYRLTTLAVILSLSYCLASRFGLVPGEYGFHGNAYKYGTYIGTLAPLCATYLFTSPKNRKILPGGLLVAGAFIASSSLGALAAISTGMLVAVISIKKWLIKLFILTSTVFGIAVMLWVISPNSPVLDDFKLSEKDGKNLRQRYIEWQAQINLLENRTITGTAAGCINDYRSKYYYRLPKLNTLKAFDQNGWLAVGGETGIVGLVCFCWVVVHYGKLAFKHVIKSGKRDLSAANRFAQANLAGFISACIANTFSSVQYNGILIVFVLVIALVSGTNRILGDE